MRYVVKDNRGKWQASYSKSIPSYSPKQVLEWAKQTAKHVGGKVYEVITPSNPQYPSKEVELYNYSFPSYKENKPSNKKNSNKKDNKRDNKKNK